MNADFPIRGPYPLLITPRTEDARLDIDILVREAEYVAGCGVNGLIWPPASEVMGTLSAEEYEAGLRALADVVRMPVVIQTFNDGKSPQPDIEVLVRLARDFPETYGWVKEESPGGKVNARMAELRRYPEIKTVFSGFGGGLLPEEEK